MNAVGIDVSKGKSTVAILRPMGKVVQTPVDVPHDTVSLERLAYQILSLGENTRVVMEATGRYHEPVAMELHDRGIFVSVVNPLAIHGYCSGGTVRKVKNDQKDSLKIAKFALDHWVDLREYTPMDAVRQQLKIFSRQYNLYMKSRVALQSNLISLTDKVFPGVNEIFTSPERSDGHLKWVDFVTTFWHCECISLVSENAFTERYKKWCKRMGYKFSAAKVSDIYIDSLGHIVTLPKNNNTKLLIQTAAKELTAMNELLAVVKVEMIRLAKELPEYETVQQMCTMQESMASMHKAIEHSMPLTSTQARMLNAAIKERAAAVKEKYALGDEARLDCMREIRKKLYRRWAVASVKEIPRSEYELALETVERFDESAIALKYI